MCCKFSKIWFIIIAFILSFIIVVFFMNMQSDKQFKEKNTIIENQNLQNTELDILEKDFEDFKKERKEIKK